MKKTSLLSVCALVFCLLTSFLQGAVSNDQLKKRMLSDLDFIKGIFEVKYAPLIWKQEFVDWDLDYEIEMAKAKVSSLEKPSIKDYQIILKEFFNTTKDYHVGIRFYATEESSLPFTIKGTKGRYFIAYIDRSHLPETLFPCDIGDEVTHFDGRPIDEVLQELKEKELGSNTQETDQGLAELLLTVRRSDLGNVIPLGEASITVKSKRTKRENTYRVNWRYQPERVRDFSKLSLGENSPMAALEWGEDWQKTLDRSQFLQKCMVYPLWQKSFDSSELSDTKENPHVLGTKSSFLPLLGKKIWSASKDFSFDAYLFTTSSGRNVGYIRIPHYMADQPEAEDFRECIELFQKKADALVIDQVNNPGGSIFYLYALASMLTDRPLYTPKHRIAITQEEVFTAVSLLPILELIQDEKTARFVLGETIGGYPVNFEVIRLMKIFCKFIIEEWNSGNIFTRPTYIFGVDEIHPHSKVRFTKPILLLTNSLDFSGGDFFPAILQDNKRATILGMRTAGAGGYVLRTEFPNQMGIRGIHLTGSIAERIDKKPIENLGVTPDIPYELTIRDLQENYPDYVQAILKTIDSIAPKKIKPRS